MIASSLLLVLALGPVQESTLRFDAAQVVLTADDPMIKLVLHIDADGIPDAVGMQRVVASGSLHSTKIGIYYGVGDGTFQRLYTPEVVGPLSEYTHPFAKGDFDGDGDEDFVAVLRDSAYVFLCDGRNAPVMHGPIAAGGWTPVDVDVADLNADGRADLVVLANTSVPGAASFLNVVLAPTDWNNATSQYTQLPETASALALFERAGNTMAAVAYFDAGNEVVREVDFPGGIATLGVTHVLSSVAGTGPHLGSGDIDADGDDDVVAFDSGIYYVLRSDGLSLSLEPSRIGGPATDLFDLDQDGYPDGVCCSSGGGSGPGLHFLPSAWEISMNDGSGLFPPAVRFPGVAGEGWAGAADVDGDGDLDLVAGRTVYFDQGQHYANARSASQRVASGPGGLVDADGDGDLDVNVEFSGVATRYFQNDGTGELSETPIALENLPAGVTATHMVGLGDFDGDGDPDALITLEFASQPNATYLASNVAGRYFLSASPTSAVVPKLPTNYKALALDWDRDGDLDVLHTYDRFQWPMSIARTYFFFNVGGGDFTANGQHTNTWIADQADLNGDGIEDFVIGRPLGLGTALALSTGGYGTFVYLPATCQPEHPFAIADLDEDGDLDIVTTQVSMQAPVIFENDGNGSFTARTDVIPAQSLVTTTTRLGFRAADFDGDGRTDLLMVPGPTGSTVAKLYRNSAQGALAFEVDSELAIGDVEPADLDLDGDLDLVGEFVHRSKAVGPVEGGSSVQYGDPTPGSGGFEPGLGVGNAVDTGQVAQFRIAGVQGGRITFFAFGFTPAELPGFPAAGVTAYLSPVGVTTISFPMPGPPLDGEGQLMLPFWVPPAAAGLTIYHQVFVSDPAAVGGFAASNALRVTYGLP